jgi:hypothetical protein
MAGARNGGCSPGPMLRRSGGTQDQLTMLAPGALDEAQRLARLHYSDGDLPALFAALPTLRRSPMCSKPG